jgi:magnesium-transporting ATPase (P-type)
MVVYTGPETKIMLNSIKGKFKSSELENSLKSIILILFSFLFLFAIFSAIYYIIWYTERENKLDYLRIPSNSI